MRKRGILKHKIAAVCICVAVLCTSLFVSDMEAEAKTQKKAFQVDIEAKGSVKAGKKAAFKITITNTTKKSRRLTKFHTFYCNSESIAIGDSISGHAQFGELKDSRGKRLVRNKTNGKLRKSISFKKKEKKTFTLSGKIPDNWNDSSLEVIGISVDGYGNYDLIGYDCFATPKDVKLSSVKPAKKKVTVKWNKARGTGYQIQYSLNKNFKGAKIKTVSNEKTSLTLKNLKSKRTYYIRIRAYFKGIYGSNYYSWSAVKKVKVK